jgi:hypothetical protein
MDIEGCVNEFYQQFISIKTCKFNKRELRLSQTDLSYEQMN